MTANRTRAIYATVDGASQCGTIADAPFAGDGGEPQATACKGAIATQTGRR